MDCYTKMMRYILVQKIIDASKLVRILIQKLVLLAVGHLATSRGEVGWQLCFLTLLHNQPSDPTTSNPTSTLKFQARAVLREVSESSR